MIVLPCRTNAPPQSLGGRTYYAGTILLAPYSDLRAGYRAVGAVNLARVIEPQASRYIWPVCIRCSQHDA